MAGAGAGLVSASPNTYTIKPGKEEAYKTAHQQVADLVEAKEPKMLYFALHTSEDGSQATTVQVHADAEKQAPMRRDVAAPWLREHQIPKDGVNYLRLYDYHYVTEQKPAILRRFRELLGN